MLYLKDLILFLDKLEERKIYYKLNKVREGAILVEITVPGERWEVEFNLFTSSKELMCNVEIEIFRSDGLIRNECELDTLWEKFAD